jgi:hypothetical protein
MSVPGVTVTITGMEKLEILQQNLKIAQSFKPMSPQEMQALSTRVSGAAADGRFELFKVSLKYDNPEARMAHDFPLDEKQKEVQEMMRSTENTGHPFPQLEHNQ